LGINLLRPSLHYCKGSFDFTGVITHQNFGPNSLEHFWILFPNFFQHQWWPWQEFLEGFCLGTLDVEDNMTFTFSIQKTKKIIQQKEQSNKFEEIEDYLLACCCLRWRSLNLKMKNTQILYAWNPKRSCFQKVNPKYLNPFLLMINLKSSLPPPLFLLSARTWGFSSSLVPFFYLVHKNDYFLLFALSLSVVSCYFCICVICILLGIKNTHTNLNLCYLTVFNITITIVNQIYYK